MKYDDMVLTATPNIDHQTRNCLNLWAEVFRIGMMDAAEWYREYGRAPYWIDSGDMHPGSFVWLCDLFDVDPDVTRSKWRANVRSILRATKNDAAYAPEEMAA